MSRFTPIDYHAFIPETFQVRPDAEFNHGPPVELGWGSLTTSALGLPDISLVMFDSSVGKNIRLTKHAETESTTVDTCVFLDGALESDFAGMTRMSMARGMQNFLYQAESYAHHYIPSQGRLRIMHFMVDKVYYTNLLSDNEKWSAELKENILNKKSIFGLRQNMQMVPRMSGIVAEILNCQLTGSLRLIMMEAKILEFIALQLDMMMKEFESSTKLSVKAVDRDKFFALREYLQATFNKDHSLRSLGQQFGLNEFKLKKGFRSLFGTTVFDYLHDLKMDYAKSLLLSGETFVNEVSGIVGYKNPNHFSTAFKRKYGINPAQFKN